MIGAFEDIIAALVALAALMPIVASIGGNTGNQAVALVIRGLALNQLGSTQLRQILLRELKINAINGTVWGSALGVVTYALYRQPDCRFVLPFWIRGGREAAFERRRQSAVVGKRRPIRGCRFRRRVRRLRRRQVDLVEHRDDVQVVLEREVEVGERLRLDALRGVDQQHRAPGPAFKQDTPYAVLLVELAEGPRMISSLVDADPMAVEFDMPVELVCQRINDEVVLPRFKPV